MTGQPGAETDPPAVHAGLFLDDRPITSGPTCRVCGHGLLAHHAGHSGAGTFCRRCVGSTCQDGPDGRRYRGDAPLGDDQVVAEIARYMSTAEQPDVDRITIASYRLSALGVHSVELCVDVDPFGVGVNRCHASGHLQGRRTIHVDGAPDVASALEDLLDQMTRELSD